MIDNEAQAAMARRLIRRADHAALATIRLGATGPEPYASLVEMATDADGAPLLLLSRLSEHRKAIERAPRISLLVDGTLARRDRLAGSRVSLQGDAVLADDAARRERFLAWRPSAALYAGFTDFALFRVEIATAHLVAGFGAVAWIAKDDLTLDEATREAFAAAQDHLRRALAPLEEGWRAIAVDPDGVALAREDARRYAAFAERATTPEAAAAKLAARDVGADTR